MHTKRATVRILQCEQCLNVFMTVGHAEIGLAFPRRVHRRYNEITGQMEDMKGVCPAHRRKVTLDDTG